MNKWMFKPNRFDFWSERWPLLLGNWRGCHWENAWNKKKKATTNLENYPLAKSPFCPPVIKRRWKHNQRDGVIRSSTLNQVMDVIRSRWDPTMQHSDAPSRRPSRIRSWWGVVNCGHLPPNELQWFVMDLCWFKCIFRSLHTFLMCLWAWWDQTLDVQTEKVDIWNEQVDVQTQQNWFLNSKIDSWITRQSINKTKFQISVNNYRKIWILP